MASTWSEVMIPAAQAAAKVEWSAARAPARASLRACGVAHRRAPQDRPGADERQTACHRRRVHPAGQLILHSRVRPGQHLHIRRRAITGEQPHRRQVPSGHLRGSPPQVDHIPGRRRHRTHSAWVHHRRLLVDSAGHQASPVYERLFEQYPGVGHCVHVFGQPVDRQDGSIRVRSAGSDRPHQQDVAGRPDRLGPHSTPGMATSRPATVPSPADLTPPGGAPPSSSPTRSTSASAGGRRGPSANPPGTPPTRRYGPPCRARGLP